MFLISFLLTCYDSHIYILEELLPAPKKKSVSFLCVGCVVFNRFVLCFGVAGWSGFVFCFAGCDIDDVEDDDDDEGGFEEEEVCEDGGVNAVSKHSVTCLSIAAALNPKKLMLQIGQQDCIDLSLSSTLDEDEEASGTCLDK